MKFKHRVIVFSSIGFGYGVLAGVLISALTSSAGYADGAYHICSKEFIDAVGNPMAALTLQMLATGLYGALCMGGSAIYSIESWGLLKCTLIHYFMCIVPYLIMGVLLRWYNAGNVSSLIIMLVLMTAVYGIIWLVNFLSYRKELRKLNMQLNNLKKIEQN